MTRLKADKSADDPTRLTLSPTDTLLQKRYTMDCTIHYTGRHIPAPNYKLPFPRPQRHSLRNGSANGPNCTNRLLSLTSSRQGSGGDAYLLPELQ